MRRVVGFLQKQSIKVWMDNEKLVPSMPFCSVHQAWIVLIPYCYNPYQPNIPLRIILFIEGCFNSTSFKQVLTITNIGS